MSFTELSIRILVAFFTLLILTRIMGRKEIGQLTFFNFISAIAIGTIGASIAVDQSLSLANGVYALAGWSVITIIMGFMDIKSKNVRKLITGDPVIVIKQGQIMENELRKLRIDVNTLSSLLRKKNVFSIADVDYAIFETDGKLSVMKKEEKQPATKRDLNAQTGQLNLYPISTEIISDGKLNKSNLDKLNLDENWVKQQLEQAGVHSIEDVFYAEVQKDGSLYIDNRNDVLH